MITIEQFRKQGYIYDSIENYKELIDYDSFKKIKEFIDSKNIIRDSKIEYYFKLRPEHNMENTFSYDEEIDYKKLLKKDDNLVSADYVFQKAHEYQVKKIKECNFNATWIFGTSTDSEIYQAISSSTIRDFQEKFSKHYYSDKKNIKYNHDIRLQYYIKDCLIKEHSDGKPKGRYCVFLYFLNNTWDEKNGGNLIIHINENEIIKVKPVFPNFVVLDSDVDLIHHLEEIKDDIKYNIVCFFGQANDE